MKEFFIFFDMHNHKGIIRFFIYIYFFNAVDFCLKEFKIQFDVLNDYTFLLP